MILLAAGTLVLALIGGSAGALSLPSTTVPSLTVPSVSTPVASTPSLTTPSATTPSAPVSTPSVTVPSVGGKTPAVHVPSVSATPQAPVGSSSSPSGASSSSAPSATATSSSSAPRGFSASVRHAGRSATQARRIAAARAHQRRLRDLVKRMNACLSSLPVQDRRVLELRTGVDAGHAYSGRQVAHRLHITPSREARVERSAVSELRQSAASGGCGARRSQPLTPLQVPAGDRLVAVSPALAGTGAGAQPVSYTTAAQPAGGPGTPQRQSVKAASAVRHPASRPTPALEAAAFAELPASSATGTVLVLLAIAVLAVLAFLSSIGRRMIVQQRLVAATAGPAGPTVAPVAAAPAAAAAPVAAGPPPVESWTPAPAPVGLAAPDESPWAAPFVGRKTPGEVEPAEAPEAEVGPAPEAPAPAPVAPVPAAPVAPPSSPASSTPAPASTQEWLRTHRSQIAIALTAAAGGAARLMARNRRRG